MNKNVTKAILGVIQTMMDRVMDRVLISDPFVAENIMQINHYMQPWCLTKFSKALILNVDL